MNDLSSVRLWIEVVKKCKGAAKGNFCRSEAWAFLGNGRGDMCNAMVKVYHLQKVIVNNNQHIMKLQAELDQSRRFYADEIGKIQREERIEHVNHLQSHAKLAEAAPEEKLHTKLLAPPHTPDVSYLMDHGWDHPDHRVGECRGRT
jgi:hypothetical protein